VQSPNHHPITLELIHVWCRLASHMHHPHCNAASGACNSHCSAGAASPAVPLSRLSLCVHLQWTSPCWLSCCRSTPCTPPGPWRPPSGWTGLNSRSLLPIQSAAERSYVVCGRGCVCINVWDVAVMPRRVYHLKKPDGCWHRAFVVAVLSTMQIPPSQDTYGCWQ
jgi:hypothetical protein